MHATPAIVLPIMDLVHLVHLGLQETIPGGGRHHVSSLVLKQKQTSAQIWTLLKCFQLQFFVQDETHDSKAERENWRNDDVGHFWMVSDE